MKKLIFFLFVSVVFSGCAIHQPLSNYARSGDTVAIAIGPSEPDLFLKREDATVSLTDTMGVSVDVTLRQLFRIYSDPTSAYHVRSTRKSGWTDTPFEAQSDPYQGQWVALIDIVDPVTQLAPTSLTPGAATLSFDMAGQSSKTFNIEILPGMGSRNPLAEVVNGHEPAESLEPMPHIQVETSGSPLVPLGGAKFSLLYSNSVFAGDHLAPAVVTTSPDSNIQLMVKRQDLGDGNSELQVYLFNPHGFLTNSDINDPAIKSGMSLLRDLRFNVVWDKSLTSITDANWNSSIQLTSSEYVDLDGNIVAGLTPVLKKLR